MFKILVVEDDIYGREVIVEFLKHSGYEITVAQTGSEALEHYRKADLVVLDVVLPDMSGFAVAQIIKKENPDQPILMLSAMAQATARIEGFEAGADDYLTKPYELRELTMRVKSLLKRTGAKEVFQVGKLRLNLRSREVWVDNKPVKLTRLEFDLLSNLVREPGKVFSRENLLQSVWENEEDVSPRNVDVRIADLRRKLREYPCIETVFGSGYRIRRSMIY